MRRFLYLFKGSRSGMVGFLLTAALVLTAVFAGVLAPHDPNSQSVADAFAPPSWMHLFGLDLYGRDTFSRVIYGSRVSLTIGLFSVLLGGSVGTMIGVLAALQGGKVDRFVMRLTDVLMSFPTLILGVIVAVALGPRFFNIVIAVAVAMTPKFIRYARGPALSLREQDFVQATIALGAGKVRIFFQHILPSILGPVTVMGALWVGIAIRIEASLSFLGVGVQPPTAAWGSMLKEGVEVILFTPWLAVFPGLAIMLTILAMNLMGDWLRDIFDPYLKSLMRRAEPQEAELPAQLGSQMEFPGAEVARMG